MCSIVLVEYPRLLTGQKGLLTLWHENGQKSGEATYLNGEPEGLQTTWHANGQKSQEETYLNGTSTSVTEWDANGTQTSR